MKRNVDLNEITDGRFYGLNDLVRAGCQLYRLLKVLP